MPGQVDASMGNFNSEQSLEDDRNLVAAIRSQIPRISDAAHRALIRKYNQPLFRLIAKWTLGDASGQDLCQLTWITAFKKITDGLYESREGRGLFSWLAVIAKYQTLTWLRGLRRYESLIEAHQQLEDQGSSRRHAGPEELTVSNEQLQRALSKLRPADRRAIERRSYELYDAAERERSEAKFYKAIKRLRKLLELERKKP